MAGFEGPAPAFFNASTRQAGPNRLSDEDIFKITQAMSSVVGAINNPVDTPEEIAQQQYREEAAQRDEQLQNQFESINSNLTQVNEGVTQLVERGDASNELLGSILEEIKKLIDQQTGLFGGLGNLLGGAAAARAASSLVGSAGRQVPTGNIARAGRQVPSQAIQGGKLSRAMGAVGRVGKGLGPLGIGLGAFGAGLEEYEQSGNIARAGAVGGGSAIGGFSGALAGAAIGQMLIPIPLVGAAIGGIAGGLGGTWAGEKTGRAAYDWTTGGAPQWMSNFMQEAKGTSDEQHKAVIEKLGTIADSTKFTDKTSPVIADRSRVPDLKGQLKQIPVVDRIQQPTPADTTTPTGVPSAEINTPLIPTRESIRQNLERAGLAVSSASYAARRPGLDAKREAQMQNAFKIDGDTFAGATKWLGKAFMNLLPTGESFPSPVLPSNLQGLARTSQANQLTRMGTLNHHQQLEQQTPNVVVVDRGGNERTTTLPVTQTIGQPSQKSPSNTDAAYQLFGLHIAKPFWVK